MEWDNIKYFEFGDNVSNDSNEEGTWRTPVKFLHQERYIVQFIRDCGFVSFQQVITLYILNPLIKIHYLNLV